ncbi:putative leucine-rich repeat receptor-like protein kinase [Acorus gramineus]|uniref:Leucine-rich repeat receptor-like protein kinase n=1 Tax=Acorus gramineus TaxID=55184 RepID=A0AAV8ZXV0_ACOGR|nr:putative leucine-rich repeat receptor-like protein kinase [Acorus gramineus]
MSSYDHNAGLCGKPLGNPCPTTPPSSGSPASAAVTPPPPAKKKVIQVWKIALIMAAGLVIPLAIMLVCCYHHWKKHVEETTEEYISGENLAERTETRDSTGLERSVGLEFFNKERQVFNIDELLRASAETMGKGNLGRMYKVTLESGCVLAVKRLKDINGTSKKEFIQQMHLLGKLRHQNLLEIISFYYAKDEKLIINEYVNGGSLFDLLHENRGVGRITLNWSRRLSIVTGVARGLAYLHQSLPSHKVPHANLKSSNVLVQLHDDDDNHSYHPKLTDFGFQPLLTSPNSAQKLAASKSPEFSEGKKKLTHKADVYCFGLLLLEIITGKVAGDDEDDLSEWVRSVVSNSWSTDILDLEILATNQGHEEMLKLTEIALECTAAEPERRPTMDEILRRIEEFQVVDDDESN